MKIKLILVTLASLFASCTNNSGVREKAQRVPVDSSAVIANASKKQMADEPRGFDTTGLWDAPIKIVSADMKVEKIDTFDKKEDALNHEGHYISILNFKIRYKNISPKRVIGVRFNWYIVDKNGKPSDLKCEGCNQGVQEGYTGSLSGGDFKADVKIGQTKTDEWMQPSQNGVKIKYLAPVAVEFYDHTKWNIGKAVNTMQEK